MLRLTGLDKKMFVVQHRMTKEELAGINLPEEELKKLVQQSIYNKVVQLLLQTTKIKSHVDEIGVTWEYRMFMFSDRELFGLLLETCELNEEDRLQVISDAKKMLGIFE